MVVKGGAKKICDAQEILQWGNTKAWWILVLKGLKIVLIVLTWAHWFPLELNGIQSCKTKSPVHENKLRLNLSDAVPGFIISNQSFVRRLLIEVYSLLL